MARVSWTADADRSFEELISYLRKTKYSEPDGVAEDIHRAVEGLRNFPEKYAVVQVRGARRFRRLIVRERFIVYYLYFSALVAGQPGRISIRAVRHGARRRPFAGVREEQFADSAMEIGWRLE